MTRYRYAFDEARVQRFLSEGRGTGAGAKYRPWLQIQDVPSTGRSHRPFGIKTGRVHHFLSDGEWKCFLKFEGNPAVLDIQEQFPMDRLETYRAAQGLRLTHPRTLDGTPYVMTVDFLVTQETSRGVQQIPYTFKYWPEKLTSREQELMSITRAFWACHGMELQLIDQRFFDEAFNINYDSVRAYYDLSSLQLPQGTDRAGLREALVDAVGKRSPDTMLRACRWFAGEFHTTPQVVYQMAMHLVAHGVLHVDLSSSVGLEQLPLAAYAVAHGAGIEVACA